MKFANELLEALIKSQEEIIEIWQHPKTEYQRGHYEQALATLKFLQGYH